jgi:2',3'-cyclic-nucleotide 3'-phosphodiesterase
VEEKGIGEVEKLLQNAGLKLSGNGELGGWVGGRVVLVQTDKAIGEWVPIAERCL